MEEGQIEAKGKRVVGETDLAEEVKGGRNGYYWTEGKEFLELPALSLKPLYLVSE